MVDDVYTNVDNLLVRPLGRKWVQTKYLKDLDRIAIMRRDSYRKAKNLPHVCSFLRWKPYRDESIGPGPEVPIFLRGAQSDDGSFFGGEMPMSIDDIV